MFRCSFCGKSEDEVQKLVAGPKVYICDECVGVAVRLMQVERGVIGRFWDRFRKLIGAKKAITVSI
jgi:ATP-dependent Clp protease ATP-binding subunit ClpX